MSQNLKHQFLLISLKHEESKVSETEIQGKSVNENFQLPEKESYQFNKCTVTATIQLLPVDENSDCRKVILSVRTHDFAPQISLVQLSVSKLPLALASELEKVLAEYQADLPVNNASDRIKKR